MGELHRNLIDGEWVGGEAVPNINPSDTNDVVGDYARATEGRRGSGDRRGQGGVSRNGRAPACSSATRCCARRRTRSSRARRNSAGCCRARRARRLAEGIGETVRAGADLRLLRRRGAAAGRRDGAQRAARASASRSPARRSASSASSRRGISRSPSRPGRSRRRSATATRSSSSRPNWCRARPGRSSTSCTAPACPRACSTSSWARARWSARRCSTAPTSTPSPSPARSAPASASPPPRVEHMRKFQLEMGGKNPLVVLDDADLDDRRRLRGQRRLLLDRPALHRLVAADRPEGIHDRFVAGGHREAEELWSSTMR